MALKCQVWEVHLLHFFVCLIMIYILLAIRIHSGFIWYERYIFELLGHSCLERTCIDSFELMPFLIFHLWICHPFAGLLKNIWFILESGSAIGFLAWGMLKAFSTLKRFLTLKIMVIAVGFKGGILVSWIADALIWSHYVYLILLFNIFCEGYYIQYVVKMFLLLHFDDLWRKQYIH